MRSTLLVLGLAAGAVMLAILDRDSGLQTWLRLRSELEASQSRIHQLESETSELRAEISDLQAHPWAVERAIREDLDLARPGEVLVRFTKTSLVERR